MKFLNNFKDHEIKSVCKKYRITNYTINPDGSIDVDGNVNLSHQKLTKLPLNFNIVTGYFDCSYNQLTNLKGSPKEVGGHFSCSYNQLTSLKGSPKEVGGSFNCYNNQLTSLEGSPKKVGGVFSCSNNQLTSLEGSPKEVGGDFYCSNNPLPKIILDNMKYIKKIIAYQGDDDGYGIWKKDGTLSLFAFNDMMVEILEEEN